MKWTEKTKYCYSIGCSCSKCEKITPINKQHCEVKREVLCLVRTVGKPIEDRKEITISIQSLTKNGIYITKSEFNILKLLPLETRQIAKRLVISEGTVRAHLSNLFKKFKVKNKTQLLAKAIGYEIITLGEVLLCLN